MRPTVLVELCAGAAALSLRAVAGGYVRPPVAYLGSKRKHAGAILDLLGVDGPPTRVWLNEPGPIGALLEALADPERAAALVDRVLGWRGEHDRELRARLLPTIGADPAAWLVCASWSFRPGQPESSAACPGDRPDRHKGDRPDLDKIAAYARDAARVLAGAHVTRLDAAAVPVPADARGWLVYMDPPYAGTTGYSVGFPRPAVVEVARRWADAGAVVAVSEGACVDALGWDARDIGALANCGPKGGGAKTLGGRVQAEWLHASVPPRAPAPSLFAA